MTMTFSMARRCALNVGIMLLAVNITHSEDAVLEREGEGITLDPRYERHRAAPLVLSPSSPSLTSLYRDMHLWTAKT